MGSFSKKLLFYFLRIGKLFVLRLSFRFRMTARVINLLTDVDAAKGGRRPKHLHPLLTSILRDSRLNYVDIGARGGLSSALEHYSDYLSTTMFEPDLKEFKLLSMQYESNRHIDILPYAVGNGARARLHITSEPAGSSILEPQGRDLSIAEQKILTGDYGRFTVTKKIEIQTARLDDIFPIETKKIDLLKIDVQGAEFDVFEGLGRHRPYLIQAECSFIEFYKGQKLFDEVAGFLRGLGYFPVRLMDFTEYSGTSFRVEPLQLHGDVVFVPDSSDQGISHINSNLDKWFACLCIYGLRGFALWQMDSLGILPSDQMKEFHLI